LNFLEREGLVMSRRPKTGDRRKVQIFISPSGVIKFSGVLDNFKRNRIYLEKFFTKEELGGHYAFMLKLNSIIDGYEKEIAAACPITARKNAVKIKS
jgi:DNA-binding PadR family transcriptional regulator